MFFAKKTNSLHPVWESLVQALGVLVYVVLIALLLSNGKVLFGPAEPMVGTVTFLLLFVFSAAVVGLLVLGKPVMLYLDGRKKEGINMLLFTLGWLLTVLFILLATLILFNHPG